MIVFGSEETADLAWEVSKQLGAEMGRLEIKRFPDGEFHTHILTDIKGKHCAVVKSLTSSDDIVQLFLLLDALKDNGANLVHTVIPYMAYARQDKQFTEGEALSAKTILKLLDELSDDITVVNCHFLREGGEFVKYGVRIRNLDAMPLLVEHFKSKLDKPLLVAPDKGSLGYAKDAAESMNCDFNHLTKKRISGREVIIKSKELDVKGKDVLILDDMISTGGTIVEVANVIRGWKPGSLNVGCVHGLFVEGLDKFKGVADRFVCTNTLKTPISKVSVAKVITESLR